MKILEIALSTWKNRINSWDLDKIRSECLENFIADLTTTSTRNFDVTVDSRLAAGHPVIMDARYQEQTPAKAIEVWLEMTRTITDSRYCRITDANKNFIVTVEDADTTYFSYSIIMQNYSLLLSTVHPLSNTLHSGMFVSHQFFFFSAQ